MAENLAQAHLKPTRPAPAPVLEEELNQARDAERFADENQYALRFVHGWNSWFTWSAFGPRLRGGRWEEDRRRQVRERVKLSLRNFAGRGANLSDSEYRKILRHVDAGLRAPQIEQLLSLASSDPRLAVHVTDLDSYPMLLGVQNGTIDLETGKLEVSKKDHLGTKVATIAFDPEATCPRWDAFLLWAFEGSPALVSYVQRVIGYALTASVKEQCWFFLYGNGSNGKSTFLETIETLLGDYARRAMPDLLLAKGFGSHPTELAALQGARFVTANEPDQGVRIREGLLKAITGEKTITARRIRQDPVEFPATFKLFLAANHLPPTSDLSHGFWRRVKLIPFKAQVAEAHRDPNLPSKLREELPGILAWAVRGCLDWQAHGLGEPLEVTSATREYREEQDQLRRFIEDECELSPDAWAKGAALFESFADWCKRCGETRPTRLDFTSQLQRVEGVQKADRGYGRGFKGIRLKARVPEAVTQ